MFHSTIRLDLSFDQSAAAFVSALIQCGIVFTGRQEGNELILTLTGGY